MKIVFLIHNFNIPNHTLQPRQFIHQIGKILAAQGHHIHVVTDNCIEKAIDGIAVTGYDLDEKSKHEAISKEIHKIAPDVVIASTTFTSIFSNSKLNSSIDIPVIANFSFPIYDLRAILKLFTQVGPRKMLYYLLNNLIKERAVKQINKNRPYKLIICQSINNSEKLINLGLKKELLLHLPPGIDNNTWYQNNKKIRDPDQSFKYLFFGPPRKARGLNLLLLAFQNISLDFPEARLELLLRGARKNDIMQINDKLIKLGIKDKTDLSSGWLSQSRIREAIWNCSIIVIPFILSESDMPVSILEAKACGKPVISTNVCSVPEMVTAGGLVIAPGSVKELTSAMHKVITDPEYLNNLQQNAHTEMDTYPNWETTANHLVKAVENALEK